MKEILRKRLIKCTTRFIQYLCEHEECKKMVEKSPLHALGGQTIHVVCKRCKKIVKSY